MPGGEMGVKGPDADRLREQEILNQFAGAHDRLDELGIERFDPPLEIPTVRPRREFTITERMTLLLRTPPDAVRPLEAVIGSAQAWVKAVAEMRDGGTLADTAELERSFRRRVTELVMVMAQQPEPDPATEDAPDDQQPAQTGRPICAAPAVGAQRTHGDAAFATEERPEDAARRFAGRVVELEAALHAAPLMRAARQLEHALGHTGFEAPDVIAAAGVLLKADAAASEREGAPMQPTEAPAQKVLVCCRTVDVGRRWAADVGLDPDESYVEFATREGDLRGRNLSDTRVFVLGPFSDPLADDIELYQLGHLLAISGASTIDWIVGHGHPAVTR